MTELATRAEVETEDFVDELSDEALDRLEALATWVCCYCRLPADG
jgi:hypothetical protein